MKIILSPSKSQDFDSPAPTEKGIELLFPTKTKLLVSNLQKYTKQDLMNTMSISEKLAELNKTRYQNWNKALEKQALFAFTGDVYQAFMDSLPSSKELTYLEKHVRIISGLYGVLTPLTLMKPYRLEMGRKIPITNKKEQYKNLYEFWRETVTDYFKQEDHIINLASNEYSKVINESQLKAKIITIVFSGTDSDEMALVFIK